MNLEYYTVSFYFLDKEQFKRAVYQCPYLTNWSTVTVKVRHHIGRCTTGHHRSGGVQGDTHLTHREAGLVVDPPVVAATLTVLEVTVTLGPCRSLTGATGSAGTCIYPTRSSPTWWQTNQGTVRNSHLSIYSTMLQCWFWYQNLHAYMIV